MNKTGGTRGYPSTTHEPVNPSNAVNSTLSLMATLNRSYLTKTGIEVEDPKKGRDNSIRSVIPDKGRDASS